MVVFKNVSADVCENCGEAYLDAETTRHLLHMWRKLHTWACR